MTVLAKSKSGATMLRRRLQERPGRVAEPTEAETTAPHQPTPTSPERGSEAVTPKRRRREAGAPQDRAMYTCQCGFVFEAQVSTSVGCPHCGGAQAW